MGISRGITRALDRRLRRVAALVERWAAFRDAEREQRGARRKFVATLRAGLARAGLDPLTVPALRRFAAPDPPPRPVAAARPPEFLQGFYDELARIARSCRAHPPALAGASPIELFAMYCFDEAAGPAGLALAIL